MYVRQVNVYFRPGLHVDFPLATPYPQPVCGNTKFLNMSKLRDDGRFTCVEETVRNARPDHRVIVVVRVQDLVPGHPR